MANGPEKARTGRIGSDSAKLGQNGPKRAKIGQKWAKIGQKWAKNGRRARIKRQAPSCMAYTKHFAGISRVLPSFLAETCFWLQNRVLPGFGQNHPESRKIARKRRFSPTFRIHRWFSCTNDLRQCTPNNCLGRKRVFFWRFWPKLAESGPISGDFRLPA